MQVTWHLCFQTSLCLITWWFFSRRYLNYIKVVILLLASGWLHIYFQSLNFFLKNCIFSIWYIIYWRHKIPWRNPGNRSAMCFGLMWSSGVPVLWAASGEKAGGSRPRLKVGGCVSVSSWLVGWRQWRLLFRSL